MSDLSAPTAPPSAEEQPQQAGAGNTSWLAKLGPGLVTGAADDDPSGIATYS
jgi:Mn2+/Fe2+ NRAMP family transporter